MRAVAPTISVISSGDEPDHGHSRAVFIGGVGKHLRTDAPLVFSTEIAATFVEAGEEEPAEDLSLDSVLSAPDAPMALARRLFKRRLHGMINVRTDGHEIYAARRVAAGDWCESCGPMEAALR